jgi:adenosylcobinamide-GDP ribazoletransferase
VTPEPDSTQPDSTQPDSSWGDAWRLAVGTLTSVRVPPPRMVDRRAGGRAALLAPWVGAGLGSALAVLSFVVQWLGAGQQLSMALVLGGAALLTRGLHLDGLADTADGLAASYRRDQALAVMHRGDVGPAGLAATVLVLLVQLQAGTQALEQHGVAAVAVAWTASRWAVTLTCLRGIPGARPDGLGAMFAGTVHPVAAGLTGLVVMAVAAAALSAALPATLAGLVVAVVVAMLVRRTTRRLGGITGDVLGAAVEGALAAALVALALT